MPNKLSVVAKWVVRVVAKWVVLFVAIRKVVAKWVVIVIWETISEWIVVGMDC